MGKFASRFLLHALSPLYCLQVLSYYGTAGYFCEVSSGALQPSRPHAQPGLSGLRVGIKYQVLAALQPGEKNKHPLGANILKGRVGVRGGFAGLEYQYQSIIVQDIWSAMCFVLCIVFMGCRRILATCTATLSLHRLRVPAPVLAELTTLPPCYPGLTLIDRHVYRGCPASQPASLQDSR